MRLLILVLAFTSYDMLVLYINFGLYIQAPHNIRIYNWSELLFILEIFKSLLKRILNLNLQHIDMFDNLILSFGIKIG